MLTNAMPTNAWSSPERRCLLTLPAVLVAPLCSPAQGADYEVGATIVGDTQTQEERLVTLFSGDTRAAIDAAASIQAVQPDPYLSLFKEYGV
jgi:hypothetical protein